jgi:hypothetical protein
VFAVGCIVLALVPFIAAHSLPGFFAITIIVSLVHDLIEHWLL